MAEAYDSAYATYMDARQRFQQLKLARGYLPIVALTDGQNASSSTTSSLTGQGKGRDKGRGKGKGKGKNKNKSSTVIRYPPSTGGKADPRGRAKSATASMTCLQVRSAGSLGIIMSTERQREALHQATRGLHRALPPLRAWLCTQSPHLSSSRTFTALSILKPQCWIPVPLPFLSGYGPFKRYVEHLNDLGYPCEHDQVRSL